MGEQASSKPSPKKVSISSQPTVLVDQPADVQGELWQVGEELDGRYRIIERRGGHGKTGMGVVYLVEDGDQRFAVKSFQRRFGRDLLFIQRFIREARTWILIGAHPNIVRAYWVDIIDAMPCLFMEIIEGHPVHGNDLAAYLSNGPLPLERALDFALQFCHGMEHASAAVEGLVHRDIKPENLLIDAGDRLKITDFGLVRARDMEEGSLEWYARAETDAYGDGGLTAVGSIFGTPAYMAPEQFREASTVTPAADVYAFGCCLYEMLAGRPPFVSGADTGIKQALELKRKHLGEQPPKVTYFRGDCPRDLEAAVMRCLEKEPEKRWPSMTSFRAFLGTVWEREVGTPVSNPGAGDFSPREVACQLRSLALLEGYDRAIRLRGLRESHDQSPYGFHLALASYFHCERDDQEEHRQLLRAARVRREEAGYEVARRLACLHLKEGALPEARQVLDAFLAGNPEAMDTLLEPHVHLCAAEGRIEDALACLDQFPLNHRTRYLRAQVLRAAGRDEDLAAIAGAMLRETLANIEAKVAGLDPGGAAGWARREDPAVLRDVLAVLLPGLDASVLEVADSAVWPDLRGMPDFAPDLAWLSHALGELAQLPSRIGADEAQRYQHCAVVLDYPNRLTQHFERDEYWFWLQHAGQDV